MLHLVSTMFFLSVLAGAGGLVVGELRGEAARIAAALLRAPAPAAARPWPARVRLVSAPRPAIRSAARRAIA